MPSFTLPLKEVISLTGGTTTIGTAGLTEGISVLTGGNIGLQYYPIFDEAHRPVLTGKIIDHYWNREIGLESIPMFQLAMRRRMNEIMPYFNKLYLSEQIPYTALNTVDLQTESNSTTHDTRVNHATNATTSDNTTTGRTVNSETPQTMLQGNADYATSATDATGDANSTASATNDATDTGDATGTGEVTVTGYQGVASELVMRYRDSLLNIDMEVINALEDLFMLVWDTGDAYSY